MHALLLNRKRAGMLLLKRHWLNDVIYLQDHLGDLRGQEQLLPLAGQGLEDALLPHVVRAYVVAVDAQVRVALLELRVEPRVSASFGCGTVRTQSS